MGQKSLIFVALALVLLIGGATAVYLYDAGRDDLIAEGVTAAGVDVGGLTADEARAKLQKEVAAPLERPVVVRRGSKRFKLSAQDAGIRIDVGGMVEAAVRASREGNVITRAFRDVAGGEEDAAVKARVSYSQDAAGKLVARVRAGIDRPAKDAELTFPSLDRVKEQTGLAVDRAELNRRIRRAMLATDDRTANVPVKAVAPKVTRDELAQRYPTLLVVNRDSFELSLYKDLKLKKTYRVAIGQIGFATPAGLYNIQNKAVNAAWSVPNSDWAGSLAGQVIPGGAPNNPLKARWLGIYDGAGIHGTDQTASLGTAASRGCVRMAIPDVIELYDQVEVQTPIYIA
jgi:lipoprotein-anchoring transpeptidase ErfK/SrfK